MSNLTYQFMRQKPIKITDKLYFHQHTMEQIEDAVGYDNYNKVIIASTKEPYEFEYNLEDIGIDYKDISYFHLFIMLTFSEKEIDFKESKLSESEVTMAVLNFMFDADFEIRSFVNDEEQYDINNKVFFDKKTQDYICAENFPLLKKMLTKMFLIKKPKRRIAANDLAKDMIKRDMAMKSTEGIDNDIYSIITSLLWSPNCKETQESIWKLTPYQIYSGYLTVEKLKNYDSMTSGIFAGTVDQSKINLNNIHWSSKLK